MAKQPAVKFRRKVYVSRPFHADAISKAFAGLSHHQQMRVYDRVAAGKEEIVFGFAYDDGSDFVAADMQNARKLMYGFD
jgi:S-adenosylmethionine synthetase